jgi:glycosyltransferase involved in cell wall biosynthesis
VFPNRCEGGTNLVAMESMCAGVPVILSANTGHLDLLEPGNGLPLRDQRPVDAPGLELGTEGWGESQIDEIIARLELAYDDRAGLAALAAAGRRTMERIAWPGQIERLLDIVGIAAATAATTPSQAPGAS